MPFQTIADAEVQPGAIVSSSLATRLRDNAFVGSVALSGYVDSTNAGPGTDINVHTISSVPVAADQRLEVFANFTVNPSATISGASLTITLTHDGDEIGKRTLPAGAWEPDSDFTIIGKSTAEQTGDIVLNVACSVSIGVEDSQIEYKIYGV